jgi:hypothetical protein
MGLATTYAPIMRARLTSGLLGVGLLEVGLLASGCGAADKFPLPDEFDSAFVTGRVCMPQKVQTGTSAPGAADYPIRFETCIYRCVELAPGTVTFRNHWACLGPACEMMLLLTAHVLRVDGQDNCDARELVAPDASECTPQVFDFSAEPPHIDMGGGDMYLTGNFQVSVPFLDLAQSQKVLAQVDAGISPIEAARNAGVEVGADRQFGVNFDPANPAVTTHSQLQASDCHTIAPPDL